MKAFTDRRTLLAAAPLLFALAYRMLGSVADAEDVLQDTWLRFAEADEAALRSPRAWLATVATRLCLDRLSADWQAKYGHPVLVVESFVDPGQFRGTVHTAQGWEELGQTDGWGRCRRDFCVQHDKPRRLFVREVAKNARRSLQAEHLKPALAGVEKKAGARCYLNSRPSPYPVSSIWAARGWTPRPMRSPWRVNPSASWIWRDAQWPWTRSTRRIKPPGSWSWSTERTTC